MTIISEHTHEKLYGFRKLGTSALRASAEIVSRHINPAQRHIYAADVCCGDGNDSTMQLYEELCAIQEELGVTFTLIGVEKSGKEARAAQARYQGDVRVTILHGDCKKLVPLVAEMIRLDARTRRIKAYGVAIYDSYDGANWDLWAAFSRVHHTIDLVMLHCAGWRRHLRLGKDWVDRQRLSVNRSRIDKDYMLIGEFWERVDFTTLYFSNYYRLAEPRPALGMVSEGSDEGRRRVRHVSTTAAEREEDDALTPA